MNETANQRYSNLIYDSEIFLTKLREFKLQSLGSLEARRKSSSTLIFPNPQQACMGPPKCSKYPHDIKPTPGYWIECHGPGVSCSSTKGTTPHHQQQQQHHHQQQQQQHQQKLPSAESGTQNLFIKTAESGSSSVPSAAAHFTNFEGQKTPVIHSSSSQERLKLPTRFSKEYHNETCDDSKAIIQSSNKPEFRIGQMPIRQQSLDSIGSETYIDRRQPSIKSSTLYRRRDSVETDIVGMSSKSPDFISVRRVNDQKKHEVIEQSRDGPLELISFEEENYEKYYYGCEHWNYFTNDELLGPVMLSLKQEVNNQRDHFHVLLRTVSYTLHGTIPASTICADRYDREAVVRELSEIAKLKPPLMLGQLASTPDELLKLDRIFIKTELKVGVIYIKDGQAESEEAILGNKEESPLFSEFLSILGDRITLKGFDKYKGGLDTVHNLTGTESVYTQWRNIEIMFHVSTMLPHEENDPQKLQKKRHIGNDIVCIAFIESDDMLFWPGCIKSYFLHTFITVRTSPKPVKDGEKRKYFVSCVCRNEVQYAFKPYLVEKDEFYKSDCFREWLLVKIVNGERASYSAPKFARMQDRTRSQLLEDIIANLANHLMTGQIPKPYRRGSWRPLGHTRASSPLEDSMKDYYEDYDQLAKDFANAFCGSSKSMLCDVVFKVRDKDQTIKPVHGVRAIMAIRSRAFLELLYGFVPPGGVSIFQHQTGFKPPEVKPAACENPDLNQSTKIPLTKRGSFGADSNKKSEEKDRRQSILPNLSKTMIGKANYLTVPSTSGGGSGSSLGTGGMIKNAFNRLVSGNWSGWSGNVKSYKGDPMHMKVDHNRKIDYDTLTVCKEISKIDSDKLNQREFEVKEFDYCTFQQVVEYIHNGQCKLSYETIPGLICAAEHYDLPDLIHACFHHANTHMRLSAAPKMMNSLFEKACFYVSASQLMDALYEFVEHNAENLFSRLEYLELKEAVFTNILNRPRVQCSEITKFLAIDSWSKYQIYNSKLKAKNDESQQEESPPETQSKTTDMNDTSITPTKEETAKNTELGHDVGENDDKTEVSLPSNQHLKKFDPDNILDDSNHEEYRTIMRRLLKNITVRMDCIALVDVLKIVKPLRIYDNFELFEVALFQEL